MTKAIWQGGVLVALVLLLASAVGASQAQEPEWQRVGLEGREVRTLLLGADAATLHGLVGGAHDAMPLWVRDGNGWSQPAAALPAFILALAVLPDGSLLLGTGRDIDDQPGVFHVAPGLKGARRVYDLQAIGTFAVAPGRTNPDIYGASAPWADRDAGPDLLLRDPGSGSWTTVHHGNLLCGEALSYFRQIVVAPSSSNVVYALEWCFAPAARQTQVWRSGDRGETWQVLARPTGPGTLVSTLAVDPSDENVLYVARLGGGNAAAGQASAALERSDDGGQTWELKAAGVEGLTGIRTISIDQRDPRRILVGTERNGVFLSEDEAETWRPLSGLEGLRIWNLVLDEVHARIFAATSDGVWRLRLP